MSSILFLHRAMKEEHLKYNIPIKLWEKAKEEILTVLIETAKKKQVIYYGDLAKHIVSIIIEPPFRELADMLGELSIDEEYAGHGMISAIVVNKEEGVPGDGFFTLAEGLGYDVSDKLLFFSDEVKKVHTYWKAV